MCGEATPKRLRLALGRLRAPPRHLYLHRSLEVKVALRIGKFYAVGVELVPHQKQHVALDVADTVLRIVDPDTQLEIDGAFGKSEQQATRWGLGENARRFRRRFEAERAGLADIRIVGDTDRDPEPDLIAAAKADLHKRTARTPYVSPLPDNVAPPLDMSLT